MARILIVDSDPASADRACTLLRRAGHKCAAMHRGEGVVEVLQSKPVDLLLVDVMLPDVSGFEICRRVRRDPVLYPLPVVFISAMSDEEEVRHGLSQGADAYITKPYDATYLVERITGLIDEHASQDYVDHLTELANAEGTRKVLQQRISRGDPFGLVYVEVKNLRNFAPELGEEARNKATRHAARALKLCGEDFPSEDFIVGHQGGGHFLCAVPAGESEAYCRLARRGWMKHIKNLYEWAGATAVYEDLVGPDGTGAGLLDMSCFVTTREEAEAVTAHQLIDTVMRIRSHHSAESVGGVHLDRRAHLIVESK